jgi:NADPH:quinone reductase-like Zn-dependent oxidoreductase
MKAIRLHELGGPENLVYEDVPDPEPGPGEVVVRLSAAALNRRDVFVTRGMYPGAKPEALPVTLGSDGSGRSWRGARAPRGRSRGRRSS